MIAVARLSLIIVVVASSVPDRAVAQNMMSAGSGSSGSHLLSNDAAVLEIEDIKKDLPCSVTSVKPVMGFDLKFHSGYDITLPLRELAGEGGNLTIVLKVTPESAKDTPVYFSQRYNVPDIDDEARGDAFLQGSFDIGEGNYHVMWMMRDKQERVCSSAWDIVASLPAKDQAIRMPIAASITPATWASSRWLSLRK